MNNKQKNWIKENIQNIVITILAIFCLALIYSNVGYEKYNSGYEKGKLDYQESQSPSNMDGSYRLNYGSTEYEIYLAKQNTKNMSIIILAFGFALGLAFHGFKIIHVESRNKTNVTEVYDDEY